MPALGATDAQILLVEEGDTQAALLELLTQQGFTVLTADNGQQGIPTESIDRCSSGDEVIR